MTRSIRLVLCQSLLGPIVSWSAHRAEAAAPVEALRNSGFEQGAESWSVSGGRTRYEVVDGAGRAGGRCLRYRNPSPQESENSHFDQIVSVEPNAVYIAGAWFRSDGSLRPVVRVADMGWQTVAAVAAPVAGAPSDWRRAEVVFGNGAGDQLRFQIFGGSHGEERGAFAGTSFCDDAFLRKATPDEQATLRRGHITVYPSRVVRPIDPLFFGVNSLFMVEDDAALADVAIERLLKEMPCRLLRYPGGEMADNYHWRSHRLNDPKHWPSREGPDTTDTDEFMAWARRIGATPIFVVNLESGFVNGDLEAAVAEAAEWVRYCNREKRYGVEYWEIGNESYLTGTYYPTTARQYAEAFARFARTMKAVDPTIRLGAIGPMGSATVAQFDRIPEGRRASVRAAPALRRREMWQAFVDAGEAGKGDPWWPTLVSAAGAQIDFVVVHRYHPAAFGPAPDAGRPIHEMRRYLDEAIPGRKIPIALTEWNFSKAAEVSAVEHALGIAELACEYIEAGVDMANYWPLRSTGTRSGFRSLIDKGTSRPRPAYEALRLLSSSMASGALVEVRKEGQANIRAWAVVSGAGGGQDKTEDGELTVVLVNKSASPEPVQAFLSVVGRPGLRPARARTLVSSSPAGEDVETVTVPIGQRDGVAVLELPALSLTLVAFGP